MTASLARMASSLARELCLFCSESRLQHWGSISRSKSAKKAVFFSSCFFMTALHFWTASRPSLVNFSISPESRIRHWGSVSQSSSLLKKFRSLMIAFTRRWRALESSSYLPSSAVLLLSAILSLLLSK